MKVFPSIRSGIEIAFSFALFNSGNFSNGFLFVDAQPVNTSNAIRVNVSLVNLETVFVLFIIDILFVCRGGVLWVIKFTGGYSVTTGLLGVSGVSVCKCWV